MCKCCTPYIQHVFVWVCVSMCIFYQGLIFCTFICCRVFVIFCFCFYYYCRYRRLLFRVHLCTAWKLAINYRLASGNMVTFSRIQQQQQHNNKKKTKTHHHITYKHFSTYSTLQHHIRNLYVSTYVCMSVAYKNNSNN